MNTSKFLQRNGAARRDLGNRASPVDRAHMKRPLDSLNSNDLPRHFIGKDEDTVLVCRNAFYLDSLNINDLTLPNSTWPYRYAY